MKEIEDAKINLTKEQALAVLDRNSDGSVHVFDNPSLGMLVGADWSKESIENAIKSATELQIGGETCRKMGHGLVMDCEDGRHFVAAKEDELKKLTGKDDQRKETQ